MVQRTLATTATLVTGQKRISEAITLTVLIDTLHVIQERIWDYHSLTVIARCVIVKRGCAVIEIDYFNGRKKTLR